MKNNIMCKNSIIKIFSILLISLCVCGVLFFHTQSKAYSKSKTDYELINRHTFISTNKQGVLQIKRDYYSKETPMKDTDSWTIFLYVAGSNLESQYMSASEDFKEMLSANYNIDNLDKVNIIIQTGGCEKWQSNNISSNKIQRYIASNTSEKLTLIDEQPLTSMGDPATLYNFLQWGVKNYPAKKMGVIFWDHGSGVENGVCQDPLFKGDPLTLNEIEYAFAKNHKNMTTRFDFIGFDTCLSGSLEYANILAPYSKYMVASSDLEPCKGWNYTPIINSLLNDPSIDTLNLCKIICDGYAESYKDDATISSIVTMSTYDLSQVDDVCIETNYLAKYMHDKLKENPDLYFTFSNRLRECVRYSDTTIDIGSLLSYYENSNEFDYNTYFYRKELDKFIAYSQIGNIYSKKNAIGLSLYYPNSLLTLSELENIRNCIFSPYWFQFIERMCYRRCHESMNGFGEICWNTSEYFYEFTFDFLNYRDYTIKSDGAMYSKLMENQYYVANGFPLDWRNNFAKKNYIYNKPFVLSQNNQHTFTMPRNESFTQNETHINASLKINDAQSLLQVTNSVFIKDNDSLIFLGENNNLEYDTNNNIVSTNFYPEWLCLPDGQYVASYIIYQNNNSTIYGIPVLIDNVPSTIRCVETKDENGSYNYRILGVWDSIENSKYAGRSFLPITLGTSITPIYDTYNTKTGEYSTTYGKEYTITTNFRFLMSILEDGDYYYSFNIEGINGLNYITSLHEFTIKDSLLDNNSK